jgi:formate dehydrogenase beta subunit
LHLIQDKYHQISAAHLAALADMMKLPLAEVFETATFYAHFNVVKKRDPPIPPLSVRVCDSLTCALFGADKLLHAVRAGAGPHVRVVRAPCVGRCDTAPVAEVGHHFVDRAIMPFCYAEAAANLLTNPTLDPIGKIPEFKFCAVKVTRAEAREAAE